MMFAVFLRERKALSVDGRDLKTVARLRFDWCPNDRIRDIAFVSSFVIFLLHCIHATILW